MGRVSISKWGCIIDGAHEERRRLFDRVIKKVKRRDPPGTSWEFKQVKTKGWTLFPVGEHRREFLRFTNRDLRDYTVDISAEPYGKVLTVHVGVVVAGAIESWDEDGWHREEMSWEEETVLSDWVSVIFRSCREACEELSEDLGKQGPFKEETEGPLPVW